MKILDYAPRVERALDEATAHMSAPKRVSESMRYSLLGGGKRIRACMLLAACEMLGGDAESAMPFACGIEMIHAYSLVHDDMPAMDNDQMRRGKPTCHVTFGEGDALLAGDALLTYAFERMLKTLCENPSANLAEAGSAIAEGAGVSGMIAGQSLDLMYENDVAAGLEIAEEINLGKTCAMFVGAVRAGALLGGANPNELAAISEFGRSYGQLFQITDDLLDYEADLAIGKRTVATILGIEKAKIEAERVKALAMDALLTFGEAAQPFRELVDFTAQREK